MQELTTLSALVPLQPRILAVVEACKSSLDHLKRLSLFTNSNNLTRFHLIRRNVHYLTVYSDVLVADHLTSSCTCRSNTQTINDIVETALEQLKQILTSDAVCLCSLVEQVAELTLQDTVCILSLLFFSQLHTILRLLAATVIAMLPRGEVALRKNLVSTKDGLTETA